MGKVSVTIGVILLALLAQQVATLAAGNWYAWLPYAAVMVLGLPALRRTLPSAAAAPSSIPVPPRPTPTARLVRALLLLGAVGVAMVSAELAAVQKMPAVTLGSWILGMVLIAATTWGWQITRPHRDAAAGSGSSALLLAALLLVAVALRVLWLDELPRYYFADESRAGMFVRNVFTNGVPHPFTLGWNTWSMIGLSLQGMFGPWLGLNTLSVRLAAAFFGSIAVLATYLVTRELFDRPTAFLAASLLACNRTAIDLSRIGTLHAQAMAIEALTFFFLWRAINTGSALAYAACAIAAALCLHTYNAAHVVPVLLVGWVLLAAITDRVELRRHAPGLGIAILAFGLVTLPWFHHLSDGFRFSHNWRQFTWMAQARQITPQVLDAWNLHGLGAAANLVASQIWKTWLGFTVIPAEAYHLGYRGGGMLDHIAAPLFILGLGVASAQGRRGWFVLYWWGVTALTGGVLTLDPPAFVRLVGLLPAACILAALPLRRVLDASPASRFAQATVFVLVLGSFADNWRTYFVDFAHNTADDMSELVHFVRRLPPEKPVYLLGAEHFLRFTHDVDVEQFAFDFPQRHLEDVAEPGRFFPLTPSPESESVYVVLGPTQLTLEAFARRLYPNLRTGEVRERANQRRIFRYLEIDVAELAAPAMTVSPALRIEYIRDGEVLEERSATMIDEFAVARFFASPRRLPFDAPYATRWHGALRIPVAGRYYFELVCSGPCSVQIGDATHCRIDAALPEQPQRCEGQRELSAGVVALQAQWEAVASPHSSRQIFQLYWSPPDGQRELVPPDAFAGGDTLS